MSNRENSMRAVLKKPLVWLSVVLLAGVFGRIYSRSRTVLGAEGGGVRTVAITQIVEHLSLDQERAGILEVLDEAGFIDGKNLKLVYQNAQGSPVTSTQIAQNLVSMQPDVIVAISTPSAQSVLSALRGQVIPVVFTAVSDPVSARLVPSLLHPGPGITGVTDLLSPESQLQFVRRWIPQLKNLGVIYNPGESNSAALLKGLEAVARSSAIHLVPATAGRSGEVVAAAQSLVGRVDAIYVPNDNTAVSAIESIVHVGVKNKLPVFAGDMGSVVRGAIGMAGYNRKKLGRVAGEKVVQILRQGMQQEMPIAAQHPVEMTLNREAAARMGARIPADLPPNVQWLGGAK